jgi:hypothetical protein
LKAPAPEERALEERSLKKRALEEQAPVIELTCNVVTPAKPFVGPLTGHSPQE